MEPYSKEFYGMKYPFDRCARPALLKAAQCADCSVQQFCESREKFDAKATGHERTSPDKKQKS